MQTEIRLYFLTKLMTAIHGSFVGGLNYLRATLGETDMWEDWEERYNQINDSRETQILLMREIGMPYRRIQDTLGISPNTIRQVINEYDLNYTPLYGTEDLEKPLDMVEIRLEREGFKLW